ncbi:MAG: permease [Candidatus Rokuibacteriota bacterium]
MKELLGESLGWSYAQLIHIVRMMYWVWVPGFLLSAFLSLRYRAPAWERLLASGKEGFATAWPRAVWYGVTASPRPRTTLEDADRLLDAGVSPASAVAALVASRNLPVYLLALLTLHLGVEFAVGHVLGTLAMASLAYMAVSRWSPAGDRPSRAETTGSTAPSLPLVAENDPERASWSALLFSGRGWARALGYAWTEFRWFWPGLALGILAGGFVLAAGLKAWWIELAAVGGGGVVSDLVNAGGGPLLGALLSRPPVGNLPVGTAFFKTDTLAYPGFVGFILASSLRMSDLAAYRRVWGTRGAVRLVAGLYAAAFLGSLFPVGVFALFGFRPGHIPLFRDVVDEILRWIPFAMPPGGMGL